jgi:hypothetical protein
MTMETLFLLRPRMILMLPMIILAFNLRQTKRSILSLAVLASKDGTLIGIGQQAQNPEQKMKQLKRKRSMESRNTIANTLTLIEALNIYQLNK